MKLEDKTALVTGAGRGFGWGIARALAQAGAKVCATDINDEDIKRCVADITRDGNSAFGLHLDTADFTAFQQDVDSAVEHWGRLDVLVHNAIYMPLLDFQDLSAESWWRQLDVGLGGLFNGTKAVWEVMKVQQEGHIIGVASGSSLRGYKQEVAYCTIKHGQEGFIKALSLEALPYNIAINAMGPGKTIKPTRITWEELERTPDETKAKWADPVELGQAFAWLASQAPQRYSGLRFDAGVIVETLKREGDEFVLFSRKSNALPWRLSDPPRMDSIVWRLRGCFELSYHFHLPA